MIPLKTTLRILLLLSLTSTALSAQRIKLPFKQNAKTPVVFEVPEEKKAIIFFYSSKEETLQICATEVEDTLRVLHTTAAQKLKAPQSGTINESFELIGHFRPAGTNRFILFFKMDESELWEIALDRTDFTLTSAKRMQIPVAEECLGGLVESGKFYLILRQEKYKKNENKKLLIHETLDGANFTEHIVSTAQLLNIFDKKFRAAIPPKDIEQPAALAGQRKNKIFSVPGKIYIVSDRKVESGTGPDNTKTEVVSIDLNTYTLDLWSTYCFDQLQDETNKTSTYVYDGKLFQICNKTDYFSLQVIDLEDKKTLFSQTLLKEDSLSKLFNTAVAIPGSGTWGMERTFIKCHKFSNRFIAFNPFIQVRKTGNDYIVYMGGYEKIRTGGYSSGGAPGIPSTYTPGGTYERSAFFYTVIHAADFKRSDRPLENSIQGQLDNLLDQITGFDKASTGATTPWFVKEKGWIDAIYENGAFPVLGFYYIGKNARKTDEYVFKKLENIDR